MEKLHDFFDLLPLEEKPLYESMLKKAMDLGCRIKNYAHPSLKTDGEERYDNKYTLSVSEWVEIP